MANLRRGIIIIGFVQIDSQTKADASHPNFVGVSFFDMLYLLNI